MTTYTITATRDNGTTFSDRVTAPTPAEAKKDFKDIYRHGKPYTITGVEVYKEDVSASKDQERAVLEREIPGLTARGPDGRPMKEVARK